LALFSFVRRSCYVVNVYTFAVQERSVEAQKLALEKTPGLGSRIDIVLTLVRIGFFFGDHELITTQLKQADKYVSYFAVFHSLTVHVSG
jgi:hypothetical protein